MNQSLATVRRRENDQPWDAYFIFLMMSIMSIIYGFMAVLVLNYFSVSAVTTFVSFFAVTIFSWIGMAVNLSAPRLKI